MIGRLAIPTCRLLVVRVCLFALLCGAAAGCARTMALHGDDERSDLLSTRKQYGGDYSDPTESPAEAWVSQTGVEARGNRPKQRDYDPLNLRQLLTSEKARSIERNLGVE